MKNKNAVIIECVDMCSLLKVERDDDLVFISLYTMPFYEKQSTIINTVWRRIVGAVFILFGKEYFLYEIVMTSNDAESLANILGEKDAVDK